MSLDDRLPSSDDEREAVAFIRRGRKLRGLSPTQVRRIALGLGRSHYPRTRRLWLPALAATAFLLVAGSAVAHVVDLSKLPLVGPWFSPRPSSPIRKSAPAPARAPAQAQTAPSTVGVADRETPPLAERPPSSSLASPGRKESAQLHDLALRDAQPVPALPGKGAAGRPRRSTTEAGLLAQPEPNLAPSSSSPAVIRTPSTDGLISPPATTVRAQPEPISAARSALSASPASASKNKPVEDAILAEGRSFSAAVRDWNSHHDPAAALAALDDHDRRFPSGQMWLESRVLRAEILLQQGHERQCLVLLDGLALSGLPRGRELQTVRGELRVKLGRCPEGRRDLEQVLAKDRSDALGRRAAWALSQCP